MGSAGGNYVWEFGETVKSHNPEKKSADANVDVQVAAAVEFPREMMCSNDGSTWSKRVVLCEVQGWVITTCEGADMQDVIDGNLISSNINYWQYTKEISPKVPEILELTIEEIAERFGVTSDQIRVKV